MTIRVRLGMILAGCGVWAAALWYYVRTWHTFAEFAAFIDHCSVLFCDFTGYYYPQGQATWSTAVPVGGYVYSAPFALALSLLRNVPVDRAVVLWGIGEAIATAGLFVMPLLPAFGGGRRTWVSVAVYSFAFVTSTAVLSNVKWGQVSALVVFSILLALWLAERDKPIAAGATLAVPIAIKYYPAAFLAYFAIRRQWRAIAACVGAIGLFVALTMLVRGVGWTLEFQSRTHQAEAEALRIWIWNDDNSQFLTHVVRRWMHVPAFPVSVETWWQWAGYAVCAVNVLTLWLIRRLPPTRLVCWGALMLFAATPFWLPTSWPHYFVYLPALQLFVLDDWLEHRRWRSMELIRAALIAASILAASSVVLLEWYGSWDAYRAPAPLFLANALLLVYAYSRLIRSRPVELS
jgi:hypothetical protein